MSDVFFRKRRGGIFGKMFDGSFRKRSATTSRTRYTETRYTSTEEYLQECDMYLALISSDVLLPASAGQMSFVWVKEGFRSLRERISRCDESELERVLQNVFQFLERTNSFFMHRRLTLDNVFVCDETGGVRLTGPLSASHFVCNERNAFGDVGDVYSHVSEALSRGQKKVAARVFKRFQ